MAESETAQIQLHDETAAEGIGKPVALAGVEQPPVMPGEEAPEDCIQALRQVSVFADLPSDQLAWFIDNADERQLEPGEILFRKGEPSDWMIVYIEGEVHATRDENSLDGFVYIARAGDPATEVSGKLPFSRMKKTMATGRAVVKTRLLMFPSTLFPDLIHRMPVLAERLVWLMIDRVREMTIVDERRDKLMALGKLSAGLAHELNNPAAAARRTADELLVTLTELREADLNLCRYDLTAEQYGFLNEFEQGAIVGAGASSVSGSALALSDREDELGDWLETREVDEAWRLSATLAEAGVDSAALERVGDQMQGAMLKDALLRVTLQITVAKLASEIKTSVTRISDLVGAIKEYSYMDQAAVQPIDLRKGLENTLLILKYKLKKKNITVVRDYAENLPRLTAHGSLLNQVWTNLIDNAVDAMPDGGLLKVRTKLEPDSVLVEIRDNGAGIPPEVQPHIFEPFYTTKGVNEGTGLGLDTVSRIVHKHRGNIRFETKPGDTCFQVRLPIEQNNTASV
jgi:signal transduction histidine kinase